MKGITHYTLGLAVASCFPEAVHQAACGHPWPMLTGGLFGLLPDLLDFKIVRFLSPRHVQIIPDPLEPDMPMVAEGLALAVREARRRRSSLVVQLHPMRVAEDEWQPYEVHFEAAGAIETRLLPRCAADGRPTGEPPKGPRASGRARLDVPLVIGYQARLRIEQLEGPTLRLTPLDDRRVRVDFLPWHRGWSHSLGLAVGAALLAALLGGLWIGAIALLAIVTHVASDQLGYLGASLLWPFRRRRYPGLQRFHAQDSLGNASALWLALLVMLWNLARYSSPPLPLHGPRLFFWAGLAPLALLTVLRSHWPSRRNRLQ